MEIKFVCTECHKQFDPDPDCVLENCLEAGYGDIAGEEWKIDGHKPELSPEDREDAKKEMGINDAELDRLLAGETVVNGGVIICKQCQDRLSAEQDAN